MAHSTAQDVIAALAEQARPHAVEFLRHFFRTEKGGYGEGDVFIGTRVPVIRQIAKRFKDLPLPEVQKLLDSPIHEHRQTAAIMLANRYPKAAPDDQEKVFKLYLKNVRNKRLNNWDIIDVTAEHVMGAHEMHTNRAILFELANHAGLWHRRVAVMGAAYFLKHGDATTTLALCKLLVDDKRDMVQKVVGWQLREVGKRVDRQLLLDFLDKHAATMPRTALRYALEHLPPEQKTHYMQLKNRA
jgi:3-methyladenine DNA glycosylase AlkD